MTFSSKHGAAQFFPVLKIAGDAAVRAPVALNRAVCLIGRRWGVHLPLASKLVSKVHALIVKERDRVYIRDLASRNRVYVNGETVREAALGPGDVVAVGPYKLHCASGFNEPDLADDDDAPRAAAAVLELNGGVSRAPLEARAVLIGSRDECDVALPDENVSSVHAVLFELDGKRYVRDLDSGDGTYVNGAKVHQQELNFGDELRVGGTRLRYVEAGAFADHPGAAAHDSAAGLATEDSGSPVQAIDDEIESTLSDSGIDLDPDAPVSLNDDDPPAEPLEREAPPRPAVTIEAPAPTPTELDEDDELLPILFGDRTVGVIDAAVHAAADDGAAASEHPDAPAGDAPEAFVPIPLSSDVNSNLVFGGVPASEVTPRRPEPVRPPETIHASTEPSANDRPVVAAPVELEDLLKYDGAEAMTPGDNPGGAPGGVRKAVRKLDRIVSELSDRVADLKSTWKHVRDDRPAAWAREDVHPPTLRDDA